MFDKPLGKELHELLTADELGLPFHLLGVDPAVDVDTVHLAFSARDHGRPLVVLRGRFDRARFQTGPGQLEEFREERFRLYRYTDAGRETTLAQAGDTLVVGLVRSRVVGALRGASGKQAARLDDDRLKAVLDKMDRKRAVWVAADLARLGRPQVVPLLRAELNPVFEHTQTLSGSLVWGEDLRATINFGCRNEGEAARLTDHLEGVKKIALAVEPFLRGEEYKKAFLRMFANAEVRRRGTEVTLRSGLQLE